MDKKEAQLAYMRAYHKANSVEINAKKKQYREAHRTELSAKSKDRYHKNKEKIRNWQLNNDYGISIEQYEYMLKEQDGKCAICLKPPGKKRLAVDHCHDTGKVRALLCRNCNVGLGHFRDDIVLMQTAIEYLKRF